MQNQKDIEKSIVIFFQYFSNNQGSYGTRFYELSKKWIEAGYSVTIITSVYYKSNLSKYKVNRQSFDGIHVIVLPVEINNKHSLLRRTYSFLKYSVYAIYYALKLPSEITIASSGPISTGIPALFAKFFKRKKFVFEVRDLLPGVVESIGILKNKHLLKLFYAFEGFVYKNATHIVALSSGMQENIQSRFPGLSVSVVNNFANPTVFFPDPAIKKEKVLVYTGNIGVVNNSFLLAKIALHLKERGRLDIKVKVVGDGQILSKLILMKKNLNLDNLIILGSINKEALKIHLQSAMFCVLPLMDRPILDTSSPNKFYEALISGLPVLQTTNGWIARFLENNQCGLTFSENDLAPFISKIEALIDDDAAYSTLANNAYLSGLSNFTVDTQANKYIEVFKTYF
jgi:glycosyltransferase involved in cell wall biosynthesis